MPDRVFELGFELRVPYSSQHEKDARATSLDCGPACVEMVGEYYRGQIDGVGTDQIMKWITGGVNRTTSADELNEAARHFYNVKLVKHYSVGVFHLRQWIDDLKPVILLIRYGEIPLRMDLSYTGGHWIVAVGYSSFDWAGVNVERIHVHDPDWYRAYMAQGAYMPLIEDMLLNAWDVYDNLALVAEDLDAEPTE